ncbi:MAG: hypothetical protein JNL82_07085 [Myxococcales bacterium]|nr:hypothetical protein [Myxococcales bacterium]
MRSPFSAGWWSFDLGGFRRCSGTYQLYPYDSVPPLDEARFTGEFTNWLTPKRPGRARGAAGPAKLVTAAERLGLALPAAFVRFMADAGLQAAVPSCTACTWDLSATPVPCRVVPGAYTVLFLRDQQDCLRWYLHLLPDGDVHVLCSPIPFDDAALAVPREVVIANTWYCAPHFEHFVYRFWLENVLWFALNMANGEAPTPEQAAYGQACKELMGPAMARARAAEAERERAARATRAEARAEAARRRAAEAAERAAERAARAVARAQARAEGAAAKQARARVVAAKAEGAAERSRETAGERAADEAATHQGKRAAKTVATKGAVRRPAETVTAKRAANTAAKTRGRKAAAKTRAR